MGTLGKAFISHSTGKQEGLFDVDQKFNVFTFQCVMDPDVSPCVNNEGRILSSVWVMCFIDASFFL
jgi:hypothetical protein